MINIIVIIYTKVAKVVYYPPLNPYKQSLSGILLKKFIIFMDCISKKEGF